MSRRALLPAALCSVLAAACARPKVNEPPPDPGPPPLEESRVLELPGEVPVVELRLTFAAGSADDPEGREGLTALTAHVMEAGAAGGMAYAERQRRFYPMAAETAVLVDRAQTTFIARVHRDHLASFYPLWIDTLLAPEFRPEDVERLREQQRNALVQGLRGADDEALGKALLQAQLFADHPYAHPELGTEAGLAALDPEQLRAQRARVLCARRLHVALAGGVSAGFVERLRVDLGRLRGPRCTEPSPAPPASPADERVWIAHKPEARSVAVSMGMPIEVTRGHDDFPALALAAAYLGQHRTFAGVLMQKIRSERGLNYGDYAYAEHFEQHGYSQFPEPNVARHRQYFSLWLRPLAPEHVHFAIRAAVRELDQLVAGQISQADFERIQTFTDRYLALFSQTRQLILGHRLDDVFYGVEAAGDYPAWLREGIRSLSREAFVEAVRRHLSSEQLRMALVAPDAEALAQALVADLPSPVEYDTDKPEALLSEDGLIAAYPLQIPDDGVRILPIDAVFAR